MAIAGQRYTHYSGKVIEVVRVAKAHDPVVEGALFDGAIATDNIVSGEWVAIYFEVGNQQDRMWACPLRIFHEVLGKPTSQYYRFTPIIEQ